jgi:5-enolpyruvylshikimate-3-phosphate synthase
MAFFWAIIGLKQPIRIDYPETVSKSYPSFWNQWDGIVNRLN